MRQVALDILDRLLASPHLQGPTARLMLGRILQFVAVITATLGTISDGMHYGWSSPIIPLLISENATISNMHPNDVTIIETIYMIGGLIAIPFTVYAVDAIGRKPTILLGGVGGLTGWIMIAFAKNVKILYGARFISGFTGVMVFVSAPMYIAEISESAIRGFLSGYYIIAVLIGVLIVYSVGPFVKIAITSAVGSCFLIAQFLIFSFMPESPYFLMMKDRKSACGEALYFLRAGRDVDKEMEVLEDVVERQESERGNPLDLFRVRSNRVGLTIMFVLNAAQHFSGISVMVMNIHLILEDEREVEGGISASHSGIIFSAFMLLSGIVAICIIDRVGRRKLYILSGFLSGFSINALATYFAIRENGNDVTHFAWVPLFAVVLYAVSFKLGLGIVPIVLTGELFPTSVKALGMTLSHTSFTLFSAISLMTYHAMTPFGLYLPFYVASLWCLAAVAFVAFYVPETKGRNLDEIQSLLKVHEPSWKMGEVSSYNLKKRN